MTSLQVQPVHRLVMQPEHLPQHQMVVGGDPLPPLAQDVPPGENIPA